MADIISRLKLESGEFDSKIKRAGQELLAYSEHCKKMGLEMGYANRDAKEFTKQLGGMETVSKTARGKINELSEAFTNLKVMYNSMTDAERNGEFGKNLAASLDQLKTRINDSKVELKGVESELGGGLSDALDKVTSKFGLSIGQLTGWGAALGATKVALDVAKDAFFASEASVDEWGRVVAASESTYQGFLTALNTGDISGYLSRINEIVNAARKAYDELDRLGTMKTIQSPKMSAQQTENDRMRMMLQTGRYIAPVDGRIATMQDGQKLTKAQLQSIERQLQNGMKTVTTLIGNEVKQTTKAIDAVYNRQAKELGLGVKEFRKGTSSMAEFDKRMQGFEQYQKWREEHTTIDRESGREIVANGNPFEQFAKWGTFRVDGDRYKQLVQLIQQRDQQSAQAYSTQGQMYRAINRADNKINPKGGSAEKDEFTEIIGLIGNAQERVRDLQKQISESWDNNEIARLRKELQGAQNELDVLQGKLPKDTVADITIKVDDADALKKLSTIDDVTIDPKTMTVTANTTDALLKVQEMVSDMNGTIVSISVVPQVTDEDIERSLRQQYGKPIEVPVVPKTTGEAIEQEIRVKLAEQNMDADIQTLRTLLETQIKNGIEDIEIPSDTLAQSIMGEGVDIPDEYWSKLQDQINEKLKDMGIDPINIDFSTGKDGDNNKRTKSDDSITKLSKGISGLNSIMGGFEKMGIEIPSEIKNVVGVIEGVMSVIQGVQTIISLTQTPAITFNTAAIMSLEAAIWANTASSWFPFANGGIVPAFANGGLIGKAAGGMMIPGNSYSGDNLRMPVDGGRGWIGVNSGELILNKSQQYNLASQLSGNSFENLNLTATIKGEQIRLALNNNGRRTGRGEYVQSRNVR